MNNVTKPVTQTSYSHGFNVKTVTIMGIDINGNAACDDSSGNLHTVPINIQRAKGALPQVGEKWVIDKILGAWTFASIMSYAPNQGVATMLSGHTSVVITFNNAEPDDLYGVLLTGTWNANLWYTGASTTGVTIHGSVAPGADSPVTWKLLR